MRFMIIRKADKETEAGVMPTRELIDAMMKYNEEMVQAGVMLQGEGLRQSSMGARVKFRKGKPDVTDGPFAETRELVAGYSIIRANSLQDAIEWVKKWPPIDGHGEVELEIRQVLEAEDFGAEFTPDLQRHEEMLRETAAQNESKR